MAHFHDRIHLRLIKADGEHLLARKHLGHICEMSHERKLRRFQNRALLAQFFEKWAPVGPEPAAHQSNFLRLLIVRQCVVLLENISYFRN